MANAQAGQFISITTPLGDDVLLLQKFTGQEGISQLFRFSVGASFGEISSLRLESLIGQNVTVNMMLADGSKRYFNGFVSQFAQTGQGSQFTYYQAEMVPWLWFLSQTSDCRIFQNKTVPEIIIQIFQEFGFRTSELLSRAPMSGLMSSMQYNETRIQFHFPVDGTGRDFLLLRARARQAYFCHGRPSGCSSGLTWNAYGVVPAGKCSGAGRDVVTRFAIKAGVASREIYDERLQFRGSEH